jgi:hypothetical protein
MMSACISGTCVSVLRYGWMDGRRYEALRAYFLKKVKKCPGIRQGEGQV